MSFMSLEGVVQAPVGPDEDTAGGFAHGGWSHPLFDPEVVGGAFRRRDDQGGGAAVRPPHVADDRRGVARANRRPVADEMNSIPKYVVPDTWVTTS